MADPQFVSGPASQENAAYVVGLIQEAAALAVAHFEQQPDEGTVTVILTAPTGYGVITLGVWTFLRDAEGAVTLFASDPEGSDG
ncbi:hypothetical protein [Streptomyces sp. NPDC088847]|uniref:hypothetical protein n=1 Tax=Streptomyces sp. NPDC088847 TaxID=3365909 RepID=UPI00380DBBF5